MIESEEDWFEQTRRYEMEIDFDDIDEEFSLEDYGLTEEDLIDGCIELSVETVNGGALLICPLYVMNNLDELLDDPSINVDSSLNRVGFVTNRDEVLTFENYLDRDGAKVVYDFLKEGFGFD